MRVVLASLLTYGVLLALVGPLDIADDMPWWCVPLAPLLIVGVVAIAVGGILALVAMWQWALA